MAAQESTDHTGSLGRDFRVAIVGGGICGLIAAIGLNKSGILVDIFESAPKYGEVGAGVGLGPNAVRAIKELGILDEIIARADQTLSRRGFNFKFGTGDCDFIWSYPTTDDDYGLGIHRAKFLEALAEIIDTTLTTAHFNKRCVSVENSSSRPVIHFADGTTHETDLVLGADGIRSTVRAAVVGGKQAQDSLSFSNTVAYRGLVPTETLRSLGVKTDMVARPLCWVGDGKHIITFPIKENTVINIVVFVKDFSIPIGSKRLPPSEPWVTRVSPDELRSQFEHWGDDPRIIISCLLEPSKWSIHSLNPELETYVNGRIALMGDAAHGMLPHLGAGAGQAIEDAVLLSRLLGHPQTTLSNIPSVLLAYDRVRVPRATMVQRGSQRSGDIYDGHGESGLTKEGIRKDVEGQWDEVWHHDLGEDAKRAVQWLTEEGAFGQ